MRVVGCFLRYDGRFLLLYRHAHKPDGNTWGLPGGKVEKDESDTDAIIRELREETGYSAQPDELKLLGCYDFTTPTVDALEYVTYEVDLDKPHKVQLEKHAHSEYKWLSIEQADDMNDLIYGLHDLFRMVNYV
jgi:8-oxo-dGTP pyrophosphatase MutT (NUDIX family)